MTSIKFCDKRLVIDGECVVDFKYPIKDAFETKGIVVVFLDPDACPMEGLVRNLIGFDMKGRKLWEAELPRNSSFDIWKRKEAMPEATDIYWSVDQREPLTASSFSAYTCRIDEVTGKIKAAEFYK